MKEKPNDSDVKTQLVFDYYKQQREEFMNLTRERSALSLQFLVLLGALSLVFNQASSNLLKLGIAAVLLLLGSSGLVINLSMERELQMHAVRARAARNPLHLSSNSRTHNPLTTRPAARSARIRCILLSWSSLSLSA